MAKPKKLAKRDIELAAQLGWIPYIPGVSWPHRAREVAGDDGTGRPTWQRFVPDNALAKAQILREAADAIPGAPDACVRNSTFAKMLREMANQIEYKYRESGWMRNYG